MMANHITEKRVGNQIHMTVDGHKVTLSFAEKHNPTLSAVVRNTLLDAYIKRVGLTAEGRAS